MFDPDTEALIRAAPRLDGLDVTRLPQRLTEAYARLVALRLRTEGAIAGQNLQQESDITSDLAELRRLANVYETLAVLLVEVETRRAAAFVAASAHHLWARAARYGFLAARSRTPLSSQSISSELSSILLFLLADYPSDALEVADHLRVEGGTHTERALVQAIVDLAAGRLLRVLAPALPPPEAHEDADEAATEVLWHNLLQGVRGLAAQLTGDSIPFYQDAKLPLDAFAEVRDSSVRSMFDTANDVRAEENVEVLSTFPGPHHLAALLQAAGGRLVERAVVNVYTPPPLQEAAWREYLRQLALQRPYLWSNHLAAIAQGYLHGGTSSVLSFPTGAGKSTLAELKIATALLGGKSVIYLAPTHALAWQVRATLRGAFPDRRISDFLANDGFYAELQEGEQADIAVMTPERCLTLLGLQPAGFENVGLLVFDECHLLHSNELLQTRRALDAMMCVLRVLEVAPSCDLVLLSAMMSNAKEVAGWLHEVTGRPCVPLMLEWKPTRQARGCLVFDQQRLTQLAQRLQEGRATTKTASPPTALRNTLRAQPLVFVGLQHTWATRQRNNYSLLPLLTESVQLGTTSKWQLAPNKNGVAARLAASLALAGVKTLIFIQSKKQVASTAAAVAKAAQRQFRFTLTAEERQLRESAVEELGAESCLLGPVNGVAAPHHGLLLSAERRLSESAFARSDGIPVLVATATLAQGMNLPAEVVIIAGDHRFDERTHKVEQMYAHELLNASGRAGRAGHNASGVVIVIPNDLIGVDAGGRPLGAGWFTLQKNVFARSDQCLAIQDPIAHVLSTIQAELGRPSSALIDRVQVASDPEARLIRYFLLRVPEQMPHPDGSTILQRSLAAFQARRRNKEREFTTLVALAVELRKSVITIEEAASPLGLVAQASGTGLKGLKALDVALQTDAPQAEASTLEWVRWFFKWLGSEPEHTNEVLNPLLLYEESLSPAEQQLREVDDIDHRAVCELVVERLILWMTGATLRDLELLLNPSPKPIIACNRARQFASYVVREVSYAAGLVTQVRRLQLGPSSGGMPVTLATLAACIREGAESAEHLALKYMIGPYASRQACRRAHSRLIAHLPPGKVEEPFGRTRRRVEEAVARIGGLGNAFV